MFATADKNNRSWCSLLGKMAMMNNETSPARPNSGNHMLAQLTPEDKDSRDEELVSRLLGMQKFYMQQKKDHKAVLIAML